MDDSLTALLATDFATEAKQDNIISAVTDVLTELELKADLTETQPVSIAGTVAVSAVSLPLPTGAATESTLSTINGKLPALVSGRIPVDGSGVTQPVSGSVGITGSVAVTGPLTDTQLRASAVPVSGTVSVTGVATETTLSAINTKIPASPSQDRTTAAAPSATRLSDGTAFYKATTPADTQPISAASLPLPSGAATSALQTTGNASLVSIDSKLTSPLSVAQSGTWGVRAQDGAGNPLASFDLDNTGGTSFNLGVTLRSLSNGTPIELGNASNPLRVDPTGATTQPISAASLPLPTGAATSANQTNGTQKTRITSDGTNDALVTNSDPSSTAYGLAVREVGRNPQTYSATSVNFAPAANATDLFTITGSATRTVRIRRVVVDGIKTATSHEIVQIIKRSTANSGGTSTTPAGVPHDSTNTAATAVARAYTANPTLGTAVGTMLAKRVVFKAATPGNAQSVGAGVIFDERFGDANQAIFLRGTSEVLAVNLNGVTLTGGSVTVTVEWSEE
jgi:hypothetical protein